MGMRARPPRPRPIRISADPRGRLRARSRHGPLGVTFHVSARDSLTLAEALRSIGFLIELDEVGRAQVMVGPDGISVDTTFAAGTRAYSWRDVANASEAQRRLRGQPAPPGRSRDPGLLTRWPVLLRLIGELLDARGVRECVIQVAIAAPDAPQNIEMLVTNAGQEILLPEDVRLHLLRRGAQPRNQPEKGASTLGQAPAWQFWRRRPPAASQGPEQ